MNKSGHLVMRTDDPVCNKEEQCVSKPLSLHVRLANMIHMNSPLEVGLTITKIDPNMLASGNHPVPSFAGMLRRGGVLGGGLVSFVLISWLFPICTSGTPDCALHAMLQELCFLKYLVENSWRMNESHQYGIMVAGMHGVILSHHRVR